MRRSGAAAGIRFGLAAAAVVWAVGGCSSTSAVQVGSAPTPGTGTAATATGTTTSGTAGATPATTTSSGAGGTTSSAPPAAPTASGAASGTSGTAAGTVAAGARLEVTLVRTSPEGARAVAVTAEAKGLVPQVLDGTGTPLAAAQTEVMGTSVTWGDGGTGGSDPGDVSCSKGGTLVPLTESFDLTHTYAGPGRYTVTFTAGACAPLKDVARTLVVTVR